MPKKKIEKIENFEEVMNAPVEEVTNKKNYATVNVNILNFRTKPSLSAPNVPDKNYLYLGDKLEVVATEGEWANVIVDGFNGYVMREFIN